MRGHGWVIAGALSGGVLAWTTAAAAQAPPAAPPPAPPPSTSAAPPPTAAPAQPPPAQAPPQAQPPPAYPYPYPYPYPPYGYAPPPGYTQQPAAPPKEMPYDERKGVPQGYRVEERVRRGPLIAGLIVGGVPYAIGLNVAAASGFENQSYWLAVPVAGPFLLMSLREDQCDDSNNDGSTDDAGECLGDVFVNMALLFDGLMQTTGAVLVGVGVGATKKVLVREGASLHFGPRPVGKGYGLGVDGVF